jgi:hypothetical protein
MAMAMVTRFTGWTRGLARPPAWRWFGPDSQVRIGQRCGIDQSDVHKMINELTAKGHVARTPDDVLAALSV